MVKEELSTDREGKRERNKGERRKEKEYSSSFFLPSPYSLLLSSSLNGYSP